MQNPSGHQTPYRQTYSPELLFGIERATYRTDLVASWGYDLWRCYEFSWLQAGGLPQVGIMEIVVPATSPRIVESKSLKLYLGSFAQSTFKTKEEAVKTVRYDFGTVVQSEDVQVRLFSADEWLDCLCEVVTSESIEMTPNFRTGN
jgi:7-cyano-7-deazaguanine reductase